MFPVLLGAELGSAAYGLSLPDSRRAVRQVNLCPTSDLLGLVGTPRPRWSKPGVDTHELGPFLRDVLAGDPNAVELLWSEAYEICTEQGEWLLRHRTDLLDGRRLAAAYLSAARRQQQLARTASSRRARFAAGNMGDVAQRGAAVQRRDEEEREKTARDGHAIGHQPIQGVVANVDQEIHLAPHAVVGAGLGRIVEEGANRLGDHPAVAYLDLTLREGAILLAPAPGACRSRARPTAGCTPPQTSGRTRHCARPPRHSCGTC